MKWQQRKRRLDPNTLQIIKQLVSGLSVFVLVGLVIAGTWYITRLPSLTISSVTVVGGETISHELVTTIVEAELEGEYLRLIPRRFSFLYPQESIISRVQEIHRIKDLTVDRNSLTSLIVTFNEFIPDALWCQTDSDTCVFLDATGYAFANAPKLTGGHFLRFEKIGAVPVTNTHAFATDNYLRVQELVSLLEANNWFIKQVAVDIADDAYLHLSEGGELKIALSDNPKTVVENLFVVLTSPEFSEIGPGNFEYIDLRFGNKVFVNELEIEVASSTDSELE